MSKLTGDDDTDTAIVLVARERSNAAAAVKASEPTAEQRREIDRIVKRHEVDG